jgi:uncharacterized protein YceK
MRKLLIVVLVAAVMAGCATVREYSQTAATVVLSKATTVSTALAIRDGYSDVKAAVLDNPELFSAEELATLEYHSTIIESFYSTITGLASSGTTDEMLVHAGEFLDAVLIVRSAIDRAIAIIEPKTSLMGAGFHISTTRAFRNYQDLSDKLDVVLAKNSRREAIILATSMLQAAIPILRTMGVFL